MLNEEKAKTGLQGRAWDADISNILLDTAKDWLKKGLATARPLAMVSIVIHSHETSDKASMLPCYTPPLPRISKS